MSGGKGGGTKSTIDPRLFDLYKGNYQTAQGVANTPYQPYTGQIAPPVPQATTDAISAAGKVTQYQPQQVTAPTLTAPKARAASVQAVAPVQAQSGYSDNAQYMNPYIDQVINASMADLERQRQISQVGNAQQSTMGGGAFGGSRLGVQEAETNKAYGQLGSQLSANLRSQGFNTSAGLMQSDYDRALAAAQGNQGVAAQRASQIGAQQQQTNLANLGTAGQYGLTQGQLQQQAGLANQGAGLAGAGLNLNAAQALGGLGLGQFGMQQAGTQGAYNEFLRQQQQPYLNQSVLNSALGLFGTGMGSQQYTQPQYPFMNMFGNMLGGASAGAGYALMMPPVPPIP